MYVEFEKCLFIYINLYLNYYKSINSIPIKEYGKGHKHYFIAY